MKRSKFDLSHYKLLTCDMGELVPVQLQEVLPGDSFELSTSALLRVSPLVAPVMHPVQVRIHHWYVPMRLLWDGWESFITGGSDGLGDGVGSPPTTSAAVSQGYIEDYLGIRPGVTGERLALPRYAYNLIYNEAYRDADLAPEQALTNVGLRKIAWEKDYFTSARPWAQRGPAVSVPLGDLAPVRGIGKTNQVYGGSGSYYDTARGLVSYPFSAGAHDGSVYIEGDAATGGNPMVYADLSSATGSNITDLRRAFALQRYAEARAQYGARYTEYLRYLGVKPSDARLQQPEYLGGGRQMISFSEVLQTGPDSGDEGVASLKGHGIAAVRTNATRRYFEEHGYIMTLLSVRPKTLYLQGLPRMFNRVTKEDFFQKELENIGQQEILKKELYWQGTSADDETFGYQDRYDEYRRTESSVSGEFRDTLNYWHLGRVFSSMPTLNESFVNCTPSKRVHAVQTNDVLWVMVQNRAVARRHVSRVAKSRLL